MNFTSPLFLIVFPLVLLLFSFLPPRGRQVLLLAASWLFYAAAGLESTSRLLPIRFFYGPVLLALITLVSYCSARAMEGASPGRKRLILLVCCSFILGALAWFKYRGFLLEIITQRGLSGLLPVGISFYTFQTLAYCMDVSGGSCKAEKDFIRYALFVSFFPQLVAGPIERAKNLLPQLSCTKSPTGSDREGGLFLLLRGYCKKLAAADFLSPYTDALFQDPVHSQGPLVALGAVLFAFQIYADFSGYCDIALGSARMMGINLTPNFRMPYLAVSLRDFWQRWHITLTDWFTEYVYIPLGGNRRGLLLQIRNTMLVFSLSGLWHGASWHFVAWGIFHGVFLCLETLWDKNPRNNIRKKLPPLPSRLLTFALVCLAWILFRAPSLRDGLVMISRLPFGWSGSLNALYAFAVGSPFVLFRMVSLPPALYLLDRDTKSDRHKLLILWLLTLLLLLGFLTQLQGDTTNSFIYFRF